MIIKFAVSLVIFFIANLALAAGKLSAVDEFERKLVSHFVKQYDKNGDGKVSSDEYIEVETLRGAKPQSWMGARKTFSQMDANGDGQLDDPEVRAELERQRSEISRR